MRCFANAQIEMFWEWLFGDQLNPLHVEVNACYAQPLPRVSIGCIKPSCKDSNCPSFFFKQMPICPFIITIIYDSHAISINQAKFLSLKTKTLFGMNFLLCYIKIDQKILVMNFKNSIAPICRKHHCIQHALTRILKKDVKFTQ
jgi:hypothetical protein